MWGGALESSARRENWEKARAETEQSEKAFSLPAPPPAGTARAVVHTRSRRKKKPGRICLCGARETGPVCGAVRRKRTKREIRPLSSVLALQFHFIILLVPCLTVLFLSDRWLTVYRAWWWRVLSKKMAWNWAVVWAYGAPC
jgi:hypothetical protein